MNAVEKRIVQTLRRNGMEEAVYLGKPVKVTNHLAVYMIAPGGAPVRRLVRCAVCVVRDVSEVLPAIMWGGDWCKGKPIPTPNSYADLAAHFRRILRAILRKDHGAAAPEVLSPAEARRRMRARHAATEAPPFLCNAEPVRGQE